MTGWLDCGACGQRVIVHPRDEWNDPSCADRPGCVRGEAPAATAPLHPLDAALRAPALDTLRWPHPVFDAIRRVMPDFMPAFDSGAWDPNRLQAAFEGVAFERLGSVDGHHALHRLVDVADRRALAFFRPSVLADGLYRADDVFRVLDARSHRIDAIRRTLCPAFVLPSMKRLETDAPTGAWFLLGRGQYEIGPDGLVETGQRLLFRMQLLGSPPRRSIPVDRMSSLMLLSGGRLLSLTPDAQRPPGERMSLHETGTARSILTATLSSFRETLALWSWKPGAVLAFGDGSGTVLALHNSTTAVRIAEQRNGTIVWKDVDDGRRICCLRVDEAATRLLDPDRIASGEPAPALSADTVLGWRAISDGPVPEIRSSIPLPVLDLSA